jgi:hypothetical protein
MTQKRRGVASTTKPIYLSMLFIDNARSEPERFAKINYLKASVNKIASGIRTHFRKSLISGKAGGLKTVNRSKRLL